MKDEWEELKDKYQSGDYILLTIDNNGKWMKVNPPVLFDADNYQLIHKKDRRVLYAYLQNQDVEIEFKDQELNIWKPLKSRYYNIDFINDYNESNIYKLADDRFNKILKNLDKEFIITHDRTYYDQNPKEFLTNEEINDLLDIADENNKDILLYERNLKFGTHIYKGVKYEVISVDKIKTQVNNKWEYAVLYKDINGAQYVRARSEFESKFSRICE